MKRKLTGKEGIHDNNGLVEKRSGEEAPTRTKKE
jgi:hypothetical protein